ncbi:hypothetical protein, partial [Metallibacterium scheffleri]
ARAEIARRRQFSWLSVVANQVSDWGVGNNEANVWNLLDNAWGKNEALYFAIQESANMMFPSNSTPINDLAEAQSYVYDAVSLYFGGCPTEGTVVAANGSVGQFCFSHWDTNKLTFKRGSARDASGNFLSINGDFSNGSNYVTPMNGGGYSLMLGQSTGIIACWDYKSDGVLWYTTCPKAP